MASNMDCLCARCAQLGKTCCQDREIYLSPGDVARITAYTGTAAFYDWELPADPSYLDQDDDPVWQSHVFRSDGRRRTLRRTVSRDCFFLEKNGCRLPMETRPLVCRLYPFSYTAEGIADGLEEGCPVALMPPGVTLLSELGMSDERARTWHQLLYKEVSHDADDCWVDLRPAC